jgi:hypothetical protein
MTEMERETPRSGASSRPALSLGHVAGLRVMVSVGHVLDLPPRDAFLLDVRPAPTLDGHFDEAPYLEALEPIMHAGGTAPEQHSVQLSWKRYSWAGDAADVDIVLALAGQSPSHRLDRATTDEIYAAFRKILAHAAAPASPDRMELARDDALSTARRRVAYVYPGVRAEDLAVTDEEHHAASGSWSLGLATPDLVRFQVTLGAVDGVPTTTHVRRTSPREVVDSVGSEG